VDGRGEVPGCAALMGRPVHMCVCCVKQGVHACV